MATLDSSASAEDLKVLGNNAYADGNFDDAESYYLQAIAVDDNSHILYTNLAAAYLGQSKFHEALEASEKAVELDHTWLKAYFRKATALEGLGRRREAFEAWQAALRSCESGSWLTKQFDRAKRDWLKVMRTAEVASADDLLNRYALLKDSREKLSTLAHFWNISSEAERLAHFHFFLNMISGGGGLPPEAASVTVEMMMPMPMQNYEDLPRDKIESWCTFFESCPSSEKTMILEQVWHMLSSKEQNDVVMDMKLFIGHAVDRANYTGASNEEKE